MADWDNPYFTFDHQYEANQLEIFKKLLQKGLIYRALKPVYWSPSSHTALAEAELEYNPEHKSPSIYVKFPIVNSGEKLFALIWTTTPWTLPANDAICYSPEEDYCIVESSTNELHEGWIIAKKLIDELKKNLNCELHIRQMLLTEHLQAYEYQNLFAKQKKMKFIPSSHVTMLKGTGLVHTAFAHGFEDFEIAKKVLYFL